MTYTSHSRYLDTYNENFVLLTSALHTLAIIAQFLQASSFYYFTNMMKHMKKKYLKKATLCLWRWFRSTDSCGSSGGREIRHRPFYHLLFSCRKFHGMTWGNYEIETIEWSTNRFQRNIIELKFWTFQTLSDLLWYPSSILYAKHCFKRSLLNCSEQHIHCMLNRSILKWKKIKTFTMIHHSQSKSKLIFRQRRILNTKWGKMTDYLFRGYEFKSEIVLENELWMSSCL